MEKYKNMIKSLIVKYKDIILYGIFGVLTTLVNIVAYYVCARICGLNTTASTVIAWILAVIFAYITNRKWVFDSKTNSMQGIIKEMSSFFGCRLLTGLMDLAIMVVFVDVLHFNDVVIKCLSNVLVIIINYAASKLLIFKTESAES